MIKIRKLFLTIVLLAVCACFTIPFTGCDTLSDNDWQEVQSITYTTDSGSKTLTSRYEWKYSSEKITGEEYENAPYSLKIGEYDSFFSGTISIDRTQFYDRVNSDINKTYYRCYLFEDEKITLTSYTLKYVKIKLLSNNRVEIDYNGQITKVLPTSYEITYFEN